MTSMAGWRTLSLVLLSGLATGIARAQAPAAQKAGTQPPASQPAATSAEPTQSPDTVVLKVGNEKFTKADLDFLVDNMNPQARHALATQGKKQLGEQYAAIVILSQQAHSRQLDKTPAFQRKLALETEQLQAQAAYDEIVQQTKVSPEEVNQYYSAHTSDFDQVVVRQVVVRKRAGNAATGPGLPEADAKSRAEAIRTALSAGTDVKKVTEDFKAPGDVIIDSDPRTVRRGGLRPEMEKAVFVLKAGEVSDVFDVGQALAFFQVTGKSHAELKDVSSQLEQTLQKQRVDAAVEDLKKKTAVWMDEQYFSAPAAPPAAATPGDPANKNKP